MDLIRTAEITKIYKTEEMETTALSDINIQIDKGDLVAITGPSGCGKSTLLNLLGMIDRPDGGEYYFNDVQVAGYTEKQRAVMRKENIGFIFQSFNLVNELTVFENIELPLLYTGMDRVSRARKVADLLEHMKMSHRKDHYPQQLSGGQQQRVAVARALSNDPKIILADEPTGNLDTRHGDEVMKLLMDLNGNGTTVVMVTHSMHYARLCRKVIRLLDGKVVLEKANTGFYV